MRRRIALQSTSCENLETRSSVSRSFRSAHASSRRYFRAANSGGIANSQTRLPVFDPRVLVSCICGIRGPCSTPQIKRGIESFRWVCLLGCRIAVAVSEWVFNSGHYARSPRWQQHIRFKLEIASLGVSRSISAGISRELTIKVKTRS